MLSSIAATHPRLAVRIASIAADLIAIVALFSSVGDTIAAAIRYGGMEAPRIGVTGLSSAGIAIVGTINFLPRDAFAARAQVVLSTDVGVVTGQIVGRVDAALERITVVVGAELVIVTGENPGGDALPIPTVVPGRAFVVIGAGCGVGSVNAARIRGTRIIGTGVQVVTRQHLIRKALSVLANFVDGTNIVVVARDLVESVEAPGLRVTGIGGADIVVVAPEHRAGHAKSVAALLGQGAGVAVVAIPTGSLVLAPGFRGT